MKKKCYLLHAETSELAHCRQLFFISGKIMLQERDHYSQFVAEAFDSYVSRKEQDGVHGNNPEIQAASELFNRPIEVYVPERGGKL